MATTVNLMFNDDTLCSNCDHLYLSHAGYGGPCLDCPNDNKCWKFVASGEVRVVDNKDIRIDKGAEL